MKNKTEFCSSRLRERYECIIHKSGLPIYVFKKKLSTVYAMYGTRYGSVDSTFYLDGKAHTVPDGIAHFLEHKLFANEDGSDSFERFSEYGADANAYTSVNRTVYLFSCTDRFGDSLRELLCFVNHPHFTEHNVAQERDIIAQEIGMYEDSPAEACYYGMLEGLYHTHSVRRNICGTLASIGQITPDLLYDCYHTFYRPDNMALVVCGDVSTEEILTIADECLPTDLPPTVALRQDEAQAEPPHVLQSRVKKHMQVSKPLFNIGFKDTDIPKDPTARQKKDACMAILNELIFCRAGQLYNELFESGLISPELTYGYTVTDTFAFNAIAGEADEPEAVLHRITAYIEELRSRPFLTEDFVRAKRVMYAEFVKEFDSAEGIASNLLGAVFDGYELFSYLDVLDSVTVQDVAEAFTHCFAPETLTLSVVYPIAEE